MRSGPPPPAQKNILLMFFSLSLCVSLKDVLLPFDDPDDLLSAYVKCKSDDRNDSLPMLMIVLPAGITDKDEIQKF